MKPMIQEREEALAAHELARTRIANQQQLTFDMLAQYKLRNQL